VAATVVLYDSCTIDSLKRGLWLRTFEYTRAESAHIHMPCPSGNTVPMQRDACGHACRAGVSVRRRMALHVPTAEATARTTVLRSPEGRPRCCRLLAAREACSTENRRGNRHLVELVSVVLVVQPEGRARRCGPHARLHVCVQSRRLCRSHK
jgi:hypothetical protein